MTLTDLSLAFDNIALAMNATEPLCYDDSCAGFFGVRRQSAATTALW